MKIRIIFKSIFVVLLTIILFCLIFIIFDKTSSSAHVKSVLALSDYKIVYENEESECNLPKEKIYEDKKNIYYLPCANSYNIYLLWNDGDKDLLKNAIKNNKVDIFSLIDHGLEVIKDEK